MTRAPGPGRFSGLETPVEALNALVSVAFCYSFLNVGFD